MSDVKQLKLDVSKINVTSDEILLIKSNIVLTVDQYERIRELIEQEVPTGTKIIITDPHFDISKIKLSDLK